MYLRKTLDTWEIWTNYGFGWEHECTEFNCHDAGDRKREYYANAQCEVKTKRKREPLTNFTTEQLAEIRENNRKATRRWLDRIKANRAKKVA